MTALELALALGETEERFGASVFSPPAKKKRSRPIRTAILIAAVAALLALAGVAAKETGFLERLFPGEKYETFSDYVNHIGVTVENEGLRLTLHEAVTDGYNTYLVYSVEVLQGSPEDWEGYSPDKLIRPLTEEGYPVQAGGVDQPLDIEDGGMGNPNRAVRLWYGKTEMNLGRISVRLFGLKNWTTGETFTPGYLEAEVALKPCLSKVARRQGDVSAKKLYTNIVLSPFGLRAEVLGNIAGMTPENAPEPEKRSAGKAFNGKVEFLFLEGEEEQKLPDFSSVLRPDPRCQGVNVLTLGFLQPADIRGVRAVRIDGVEYPLETGPLPRQRLGLMDTAASPLESARAWVYGEHDPAHPDLTGEGTEVTLRLDGVWTDGYTTELLLQSRGGSGLGTANALGPTVDLGGGFMFEALNAAGEPVAVGVRSGGAAEGLLPFVAECTEKAETLIIRQGDAELIIPLSMKQLRKLPQATPQEPHRLQIDPEVKRQSLEQMYRSLFAGYSPAEVSYRADNGAYRITVEHMALRIGSGSASLRAWVVCSAPAGEYDRLLELSDGFYTSMLSEGRTVPVSWGGGIDGSFDSETGERVYCLKLDFEGDFSHADALRLTWTPPSGDRITLDLERTH